MAENSHIQPGSGRAIGVRPDPIHYLALIGDIRRSRQLPDRRTVQERLRTALDLLDRRYSGELASGFAITTGDEFQALLTSPAIGLAVVVACEEALEGLDLRYGLGWGTLATRLEPRAVGMDGPCFHAAREAIDAAKETGRWLGARGFGSEADQVLDGVFGLIGAVREEWTELQARAVAMRRRVETQRELADRLSVDPSTVSKRLKSALYDEVVAAEQAAAHLLDRFGAEAAARSGAWPG